MDEVDRLILTQWLDAISDSHASIDHISWLYTIATNSKPISQSKVKAATAQPKVRVSVSPNFTPYQPQKTMNLTVSSALHQKATSPLGARDQTSGFIYLFWDKQYFGMVKIGYTKDLTERLKSWNRDCKREHVYHSSRKSQANMSHVHRVEQLIHTELKEYRRRRKCEGCGKMHKEWFNVAEVHAVKVARKWREWILQEPYAQDADSGQWVIRPEMLDSLERMCEPLPHNMSTQRSRRRSEDLQRVSRKKKGPR
jgi:predicted GIY-YIG superfamily endonuclease